jgi:hypothetical protein
MTVDAAASGSPRASANARANFPDEAMRTPLVKDHLADSPPQGNISFDIYIGFFL